VCGHGKSQPHVHSRGITFDRSIEELLDFCESDDLIKLPANLYPAHSEDCTIEKDILPSGQLRMEAGADFQEAGHTPLNADPTGCWLRNSTKDFEQSGFSGAVAADDSHDFTLLDIEGNVLERPKLFRLLELRFSPAAEEPTPRGLKLSSNDVAKGNIAFGPLMPDDIFLAQVLNRDGDLRHTAMDLFPRTAVLGCLESKQI
jgi:hypothetical protein